MAALGKPVYHGPAAFGPEQSTTSEKYDARSLPELVRSQLIGGGRGYTAPATKSVRFHHSLMVCRANVIFNFRHEEFKVWLAGLEEANALAIPLRAG